jgi:nucleoside-diphosphate-sugar epimerase
MEAALRRHQVNGRALTARLEDRAGLERELSKLRPPAQITYIHLAARVSVPACESDPEAARHINVTLAQATAETVIGWAANIGSEVRIIYVSTGHVYAAQPVGSRIVESAETSPRSVYADTKLAAEHALAALAEAHSVPLMVARVFGLVAPRQAPNYVLPALIRRAHERDVADIPGLDYSRDYLDARDVCDDLLLLAVTRWQARPSIVNVCSGVPVTIRELLAAALNAVHPQGAPRLLAQATAAPGRPDDVPWLVGDPTLFAQLTGAVPQRTPLVKTIADAVAQAP